MRFNHLDYERQLAATRLGIMNGPSTWRETIQTRWGNHLLMIVKRHEKDLDDFIDQHCQPGPNTAQAKYIETRSAELAVKRQDAENMIAGKKEIRDPVTAEATLRLYIIATTPHPQPGDK